MTLPSSRSSIWLPLRRPGSIPGIGQVIATELILASDEFKAIDDPKKLACHAGVAPFEHSSGSSVRGKTRVNHHARKSLKTLLHLGAMSALQVPGELQDYYQRKVKEGKNKIRTADAVGYQRAKKQTHPSGLCSRQAGQKI